MMRRDRQFIQISNTNVQKEKLNDKQIFKKFDLAQAQTNRGLTPCLDHCQVISRLFPSNILLFGSFYDEETKKKQARFITTHEQQLSSTVLH
jgi:hypothetical protein